MKTDSMRIHVVPDCKDQCALCGEIEMGCHFDHDLAALAHGRGHIGYECSAWVMNAEDVLRAARLTVPTVSILEANQ
jgi:hypothetical protein